MNLWNLATMLQLIFQFLLLKYFFCWKFQDFWLKSLLYEFIHIHTYTCLLPATSSICCLLLHIKHMSNGKRVPPVRMMNVGNCSHSHPLLLSHLRIIIKVNIFYNAADIMTDSTADSTHIYTHTHTHMSIHPSALILCSTK